MGAGENSRPIKLWLLAAVLLLVVGPPMAVVWLDMAKKYLGAIRQLLAVTWLARLGLLAATIYYEVDPQVQTLSSLR